MLPKKNRLPKNSFTPVYKKGKRIYSKYFTLIYLHNSNITAPQIGIVVSNKVSKKAIERNKIKRRLRSILQSKLSAFKSTIQLILITKPTVATETSQQLEKALNRQIHTLINH